MTVESPAVDGARGYTADDMIGHLIEAEVQRPDGEVEHLTDLEISRFLSLQTAAGSETDPCVASAPNPKSV